MRRIVHGVLLLSAILATFAGARFIPSDDEADDGWPRQRTSDGSILTLYQPQVERWHGDQLEARAAVAVRTTARAAPSYAAIAFSARAAVDKPDGVVLLEHVVVRAGLSSLSAKEEALVQQWLPAAVHRVALDHLQASLAASADDSEVATTHVRNDPPRIIVTTSRAVLISIDGPPAMRPIAGTQLERIINTRALLVRDAAHGRYYLYLGDCWMSARRLDGLWAQAVVAPPPALEAVRRDLAGTGVVDLFDDKRGSVRQSMERGTVPRLIVSTTPAALVELEGAPQLEAIEGTRLVDVVNSGAALFRLRGDHNYYLLLSGRWYRSPSLVDGAWSFVAAPPAELATLPPSHAKAWIRASLPGTREAREAAAAHAVPQTATVRRGLAHPAIGYDGAPMLAAIDGTSLHYASNSATPVIRAAARQWYALVDGVWLTGDHPLGPWQVATAVPDEIYAIPPSSALHHVTYARIYGATHDSVRVGYLPGYLGSYLGDGGTVVYGTGWHHTGWCGRLWLAPPSSFGAGTRWQSELDHRNAYGAWPAGLVTDEWEPVRLAMHRARRAHRIAVANDLYAGRDGWVYRRDPVGWQRFADEGWRAAELGSLSATAGGGVYPSVLGELDRERAARRRAR
jgi:hypothetical protein